MSLYLFWYCRQCCFSPLSFLVRCLGVVFGVCVCVCVCVCVFTQFVPPLWSQQVCTMFLGDRKRECRKKEKDEGMFGVLKESFTFSFCLSFLLNYFLFFSFWHRKAHTFCLFLSPFSPLLLSVLLTVGRIAFDNYAGWSRRQAAVVLMIVAMTSNSASLFPFCHDPVLKIHPCI